MIKRVLSLALLTTAAFGLTVAAWAPRATTPRPVDREGIIAGLRVDIDGLASESRYSTQGYRRAIEYIRSQARAAGLEVVTEPVEGLSQWKRGDSDGVELLLPNGQAKPLRAVTLTKSAGGEVEGEVMLVNYFFDKNQGPPPQRFDAGGKRRIVFFSRPLEIDPTVNGYAKTVPQRTDGAIWAARYGAAAVIVRSVQTGKGPAHTGLVRYADEKAGIPQIPAVALDVEYADELTRLLCPGATAEGWGSQLCDGKVSVRLRVAPKQAERRLENVVIRIPGTTRAGEIVLACAHLDSHDTTPGAADDAAGVAAVLAVMREFAKNRPARTLLLVLFADEELGGAGARAFASRHRQELSQIVAATEMDEGDGPPRGLQITASPTQTREALSILRRIADRVGPETTGLELRTDTNPNGADVEPLWREGGVPEVAINQDFTRYFDRHHATNDTPDNVDYEGLRQTTSLLIQLVRVLASGEFTPPGKTPAPLGTGL